LGTGSALVAAALFASYMAPSVVGGPLAGRFSPAAAQRIGMTAFVVGVGGLILGLRIGSIGLFLVAGVLAGVAQAVAFTGSVRGLLTGVRAADRAGLLSAVYLLSYGGAAIPSFIAGRLSSSVGLLGIATGYGLLALTAGIVVLIAARNPKPASLMPAAEDMPPELVAKGATELNDSSDRKVRR